MGIEPDTTGHDRVREGPSSARCAGSRARA